MAFATRVAEFDIWRPSYGGAVVSIYRAGTTELLPVFLDPALTIAAANPQTLLTILGSGLAYGRWAQPVYVGASYQLSIDGSVQTGVERPALTNLIEVDASAALVTPTNGTAPIALRNLAAFVVRAESHGRLGGIAVDNDVILAAAIGEAAAAGGGEVWLPAGNFPHTIGQIPQNVVLRGRGRGVTVLRSNEAQAVWTIAGNSAGFRDLTLDGVNLIANSIGIYSVGRADVVLDNVEVKRFATGWLSKGGDRARWRQLFLSNCNVGAEVRGDSDTATTNTGGPARSLSWDGGKVDLCTTAGVILSFEDRLCEGISISHVDWLSNPSAALRLNGARDVQVTGGRFEGNSTNLALADDSDTAQVSNNTVKQVEVRGARFVGGQSRFDGFCERIRFIGCLFEGHDFRLSIPLNPIVLEDCSEDANTTATGATEKLLRSALAKRGEVPGVTTDATWTTAWSMSLVPGDLVRLRARILGRQRNGTYRLSGEIVGTASRAPAELAFNTAVGTLAIGSIVSGVTSGASARIVGATQAGSTGTLQVRDVKGAFLTSETINTSAGQSARCTSPLSDPAVTVDPTHVAKVTPAPQDDAAWDYAINGSTPLVRVQVKGNTGLVIEWLVEVDVLRP
ncbi:MAG: Pectate lyase superfamily protein [Verrucomicrobiota bacterium]|jgi:hypothetical protein